MKTNLRQPLALILGCLILAAGLLPWCLIWLSDQLFFDITTKLMWTVFGGPAILALAAMIGTLLCQGSSHIIAPIQALGDKSKPIPLSESS